MAARHIAATMVGFASGLAYVAAHGYFRRELAPFHLVASVIVTAVGLILNGALLFEIVRYTPRELGKLGHAKNTILLSLIIICSAAPYALYTIFVATWAAAG